MGIREPSPLRFILARYDHGTVHACPVVLGGTGRAYQLSVAPQTGCGSVPSQVSGMIPTYLGRDKNARARTCTTAVSAVGDLASLAVYRLWAFEKEPIFGRQLNTQFIKVETCQARDTSPLH